MKYFLWFLRILVGVLFIFSGLVKANDPLGLTYKMDEFFEAWHMAFMAPYAMAFSIIMIAFEIIAGVALLLGFAFRLLSFLLLLLNLFYTFVTAYALYSGKVKECGCFGNCIPISNMATFSKDVILLIMSVILFAYRERISPLFSKYPNTALMILTVFFSFFIQWWALEHLPFYDCLAYKAGNNLWQKMQVPAGSTPDKYESVFTYEKNGVQKEFTMNNYPWQDTTWKFIDRKDKLVSKGNADPEIKDFSLTDLNGNDNTKDVLTAPGYTFLWFVRDPAHARMDNIDSLHVLINKAVVLNIPFYVICSADHQTDSLYQQKWNMTDIPFYILDGTVSKTAMRSNPGLMLLNNGVVVHKWSYRDYPRIISLENGKLNLK
jgi:uncharacterized membrane protein YphA (DoxX/SURF4 family)